MVGYYLAVSGMTASSAAAFVRKHMPSPGEMLHRCRMVGLPEADEDGKLLIDYIAKYRRIPSLGATIRFVRGAGDTVLVRQIAWGAGVSRVINEGLCQMVRRHLAREFRRAGIRCRAYKF